VQSKGNGFQNAGKVGIEEKKPGGRKKVTLLCFWGGKNGGGKVGNVAARLKNSIAVGGWGERMEGKEVRKIGVKRAGQDVRGKGLVGRGGPDGVKVLYSMKRGHIGRRPRNPVGKKKTQAKGGKGGRIGEFPETEHPSKRGTHKGWNIGGTKEETGGEQTWTINPRHGRDCKKKWVVGNWGKVNGGERK